MNKISLKNLNLKEIEQLSREQLKGVLGGYTGSTGTDEGTTTDSLPGDVKCNCNRNDQCSGDTPECANSCGGPQGNYYGVCVAKQSTN